MPFFHEPTLQRNEVPLASAQQADSVVPSEVMTRVEPVGSQKLPIRGDELALLPRRVGRSDSSGAGRDSTWTRTGPRA